MMISKENFQKLMTCASLGGMVIARDVVPGTCGDLYSGYDYDFKTGTCSNQVAELYEDAKISDMVLDVIKELNNPKRYVSIETGVAAIDGICQIR